MPEAASAGVVLLDKPAGVSSFAALRPLRAVYGRRLGHAGTLDPFATGLLLVLTGRATRLVDHLHGLDKAYTAVVQFGAETTTDDPEGERTATGRVNEEAAVHAALPALTGQIEQVPPAASAVHVDGERAYRRFRRGEAVTVPPRTVTVHALDLIRFDAEAQTAELEVVCGSGTYVRSLARDLGRAVGAGAHLTALRRTRIGPFRVEDAAAPDAVGAAAPCDVAWRPAAAITAGLPQVALDADQARAVAHGRGVPCPGEGPVALLDDGGRLLALGEAHAGEARPRVVLEPAP
ncbi:MAG: tRNA pseudouridine(55) synthase TruB [Actinomycetota bacterium]